MRPFLVVHLVWLCISLVLVCTEVTVLDTSVKRVQKMKRLTMRKKGVHSVLDDDVSITP